MTINSACKGCVILSEGYVSLTDNYFKELECQQVPTRGECPCKICLVKCMCSDECNNFLYFLGLDRVYNDM